jgi:hypothetical protein
MLGGPKWTRTATVVVFVAAVTTGAAPMRHREMTLVPGRPASVLSPAQPKPIQPADGIDFTDLTSNPHQVRDFVANYAAGFTTETRYTVSGSTTCYLSLSAANGSAAISTWGAAVSSHTYLVGRIANKGTTPCPMANGAILSKGESVALFVTFHSAASTAATAQYGEGFGHAYVVAYDPQRVTNDRWILGSAPWTLGQCGHSHPAGAVDEAHIEPWAGKASGKNGICDYLKNANYNWNALSTWLRDKNSQSVSKNVAKNAPNNVPKNVPLDINASDPDAVAFWFACGTDCCFVDLSN